LRIATSLKEVGGKFTSIVLVSLLQGPYRPRRLAGGEQLATSAALEIVPWRVCTVLPYPSAHGKVFKRSLTVIRLEVRRDKYSVQVSQVTTIR
jgi:hypothetical protein